MSEPVSSRSGAPPGRGRREETSSGPPQETAATGTTVGLFASLRKELDEHHNKIERLIRVSRDVTADSKKVIFTLQRYNLVRDLSLPSSHQGPRVHPANARLLLSAQSALDTIRSKIITAAQEEHLNPDSAIEADRYERYYGSGLEEFIEALSLQYFLEHHSLIPYRAVQDLFYLPQSVLSTPATAQDGEAELAPPPKRRATGDVSPSHRPSPETIAKAEVKVTPMETDEMIQIFSIPPERYLLGISDVAGELMRVATNAVGGGDVTGGVVTVVLSTLRELYETLEGFFGRLASRSGRELKKKQSVTQESIRKIENVLYGVKVRAEEYADADVALLQEMVRRSLAQAEAPPEEE